MLYAKVVLGIPVEGPFDYLVPERLLGRIKPGMRVWVDFRTQKTIGYVVTLAKKTAIKNVKPIIEVIDVSPVLDKNMLLLTKKISRYYCCSWGEAIETALPEVLRKGKRIPGIPTPYVKSGRQDKSEIVLIHDWGRKSRWDIYLEEIRETLRNNQSAIVLLPSIDSLLRGKEAINTNLGIEPVVLYRKEAREIKQWLKAREATRPCVVIGTRSAIFAPLSDLGLVIIDEEEYSVYKQDQVPHYHAREAAFLRAGLEKAKVILGSAAPSLEALYLARINKIKYTFIERRRPFPEIKIVDTSSEFYLSHKKVILSKYLQDLILSSLTQPCKVLLFLNRRGFATFASCRHCGKVLVCPRCNVNLVYHFKENILNCHYCNFKTPPPNICPSCNCGYIGYSGMGTEKIESELSRLFPQARIKRLDEDRHINISEADIFISTQSVIRQAVCDFELVGVLSIDNSLNRIDFRAAEKTFGLLVRLLAFTNKKMVIQTSLPKHPCFQAVEKKDINIFYDEELIQRRQLGFPPYQHLALVKIRGRKEERVKKVSEQLFSELNAKKNKSVRIISLNPGQPPKLRGNFYWQILTRAKDARKISKFLKIHLKDFPHSGIIITVDIDPL